VSLKQAIETPFLFTNLINHMIVLNPFIDEQEKILFAPFNSAYQINNLLFSPGLVFP